ncbi:ABC transporter permease [Niabella yanshanensis]|uniref:ABC transporter permease n=1 Tax=Niabella yanshanensis TaxID=577386 RepID=A0ABZ0W870_9BACT|nr:ABC transporter permease [Niabella yanshanensis]WQD39346.1 ABC transporter permease [Niabella yanshanensis]
MSYSQSRALWAITKASFKAIFSQPSSLFFSFLFPIIFILIFGALSERPPEAYKVAISPYSDTASVLFDSLRLNPRIKIVPYADTAKQHEDLIKGNIAAVLNIAPYNMDSSKYYKVKLLSSEASGGAVYNLMRTLDYQALKIELDDAHKLQREYAFIPQIVPGKKYRQIDFVLPGQLGFSILFATMFGIAFVFFNLREQLVLKRFYASPVRKINILIGIGASRLVFQLINVIVLILFGHFFLKFTLINGALTFFEMILLTVYMLFLLMGVGLIFASLAKTDTSIPLLINLFGFPQILLSGTFFSINVFPPWLQNLCQALPLTQFNNAMRKISFEGLHLFDCWKEIGILGIWIVIVYLIVMKVMKWE